MHSEIALHVFLIGPLGSTQLPRASCPAAAISDMILKVNFVLSESTTSNVSLFCLESCSSTTGLRPVIVLFRHGLLLVALILRKTRLAGVGLLLTQAEVFRVLSGLPGLLGLPGLPVLPGVPVLPGLPVLPG